MPRLRRGPLPVFVLLALGWPTLVLAQGSKAGVVTTLQGRATAARVALPQPVALKFKDDVFLNDRIVTGDRSIARLLLGGKALVTVRERSELTITEIPGRSTIELDSGKIAVAVARDRMQPGETIEVKTPNALAAVRGTVFVAEVTRAASVTSSFYGFTGQVVVTAGTQTFTLLPKTVLRTTGSGPATLEAMTASDEAQALSGLRADIQPVSAGQEGAKDLTVDTTIATLGAGPVPALPGVTPPPATLLPPSLPLPQQPPILPGGISGFSPAIRTGCGLPVCID
jgi:hypothetical protein